jgi:hypothetical protein
MIKTNLLTTINKDDSISNMIDCNQEFISSDELAKIYGINPQTARIWCKTGKIEAKKINGRWYVKKDRSNKDEK